MGEFDGLVALVTGGASGIGAATVALLQSRGARVAILDRDTGGADPQALALRCDVTDRAAVQRFRGRGRRPLRRARCCGQQRRDRRQRGRERERRRRMAPRPRRQCRRHRPRDQGGVAASSQVAARGGGQHLLRRGLHRPALARAVQRQQGRRRRADPGHGRRSRARGHPGERGRPRNRGHAVGRTAAERQRGPGRHRRGAARPAAAGRLVTAQEVAHAIASLASPAAASTTGTILCVDGGLTSLRV